MKNKSAFKLRSGNKTSFKQMGSSKPKDNIGEGFMNPPYKKPVGPTEKAKGYHGFKNFKSNISNVEHDDQSKESARLRGELCAKCDNRKGNCVCPSSPAKRLKKDEQIIDGQLCDAYGNPKPSNEDMRHLTQCPDFSNKKSGPEQGLFGNKQKEQKENIKQEAAMSSGKDVKADEEAKKKEKEEKKKKDMETMESSIDATLGKS